MQILRILGEVTDCSLTTVFLTDLQKILSKRRVWGRYTAKANFKGDKIGLFKNRRKKLATEKQGEGRLFY